MTEQEAIPEAKTIDVHVTKKRSSLLKYLVVFLFVVLLGILVWSIGFKNYSDYKNIIRSARIFNSEEIKPEKVVVKETEATKAEVPNVEAKPLPELPPEPTQSQHEIESLTGRLEAIEAQNKNLTLYIATRELKEKIHDPADFAAQLEFISDLSTGEADIEGRVDLLKQASANGIPTKESLLADLAKLSTKIDKQQEKTFWGSVKNSFNGLIKITKVKGDVEGGNYQAVIKRAELALDRQDYKTAATEVEKIGAEGEAFVKKANNLQRVIEITDSLVEFSKAHFGKTKQEAEGESL
jgi:hypothetical protein